MLIQIGSKKHGTQEVKIDDEDFDLIKDYKIYVYKHTNKKTFYAMANNNNTGKSTSLHHIILKPRKGYQIDHIDHNGLNNTKLNLRECSSMQNARNRLISSHNTSGFKGVSFRSNKKLYFCSIRVNRKLISGGNHKNILIAACKYNELALKYFGEFASLNEFTEEQQAEIKNPQKETRHKNKNNTTGYIGVSPYGKKFIATIYYEGKNRYLGSHENPEQAALAYNNAALLHKGDKASINTIK